MIWRLAFAKRDLWSFRDGGRAGGGKRSILCVLCLCRAHPLTRGKSDTIRTWPTCWHSLQWFYLFFPKVHWLILSFVIIKWDNWPINLLSHFLNKCVWPSLICQIRIYNKLSKLGDRKINNISIRCPLPRSSHSRGLRYDVLQHRHSPVLIDVRIFLIWNCTETDT